MRGFFQYLIVYLVILAVVAAVVGGSLAVAQGDVGGGDIPGTSTPEPGRPADSGKIESENFLAAAVGLLLHTIAQGLLLLLPDDVRDPQVLIYQQDRYKVLATGTTGDSLDANSGKNVSYTYTVPEEKRIVKWTVFTWGEWENIVAPWYERFADVVWVFLVGAFVWGAYSMALASANPHRRVQVTAFLGRTLFAVGMLYLLPTVLEETSGLIRAVLDSLAQVAGSVSFYNWATGIDTGSTFVNGVIELAAVVQLIGIFFYMLFRKIALLILLGTAPVMSVLLMFDATHQIVGRWFREVLANLLVPVFFGLVYALLPAVIGSKASNVPSFYDGAKMIVFMFSVFPLASMLRSVISVGRGTGEAFLGAGSLLGMAAMTGLGRVAFGGTVAGGSVSGPVAGSAAGAGSSGGGPVSLLGPSLPFSSLPSVGRVAGNILGTATGLATGAVMGGATGNLGGALAGGMFGAGVGQRWGNSFGGAGGGLLTVGGRSLAALHDTSQPLPEAARSVYGLAPRPDEEGAGSEFRRAMRATILEGWHGRPVFRPDVADLGDVFGGITPEQGDEVVIEESAKNTRATYMRDGSALVEAQSVARGNPRLSPGASLRTRYVYQADQRTGRLGWVPIGEEATGAAGARAEGAPVLPGSLGAVPINGYRRTISTGI